MPNQEHLGKLYEGVEAWNHWRADRAIVPDLDFADLAGKDLCGADLRGANLEGAKLCNARLGPGTPLRNANLSKADLYQANLSGADLQDVNFTGADLFGANLREANLQGADLSGAQGGLRTEQLAGADLTGAKLPDQLKKLYESLDNVKGISESARKIFLAVLAGCLYCWLTIATTADVNLITNRASSPLPIIQTPIPIVGFYVIAPLLVLCVYFYFHFYLQKLWEELGSLPAIFHDGRPLHTKVDPWLLNDLVRAHLPKLNVNRPFLSHLQLWISVLLAWWVVPITMLLFWGRYLRRHESIGTAFHVVLLVISLVAAVSLYRLAVATLRGTGRKPFAWKGALRSCRGYQTATFAVAAGVLFGLVSWGAIWGVRSGAPILGVNTQNFFVWGDATGLRTWIPRFMALVGYPPFANLTGAEVSQKRPTWTARSDRDPGSVIGARLIGANLQYAEARAVFLAEANLTLADLTGADIWQGDLSGAKLRGARLRASYLDGAVLTGADIEEADLSGAYLIGTKLNGANLLGVLLRGANLDRADLTGAKMGEADLTSASLNEAHLLEAYLVGVHLTGAKMAKADLTRTTIGDADLTAADLTGARMRRADLSGTRLDGAILIAADLGGANLTVTHLNDADLTYSDFRETKNLKPEQVKRAVHWDKAFYDRKIIEALSLPPNHNKNVATEKEEVCKREYPAYCRESR